MALNSELILCKNVKLNKNYNIVLTYSEDQMVALCRSLAVATSNNYSFIRESKNEIQVSTSYRDALKCNYMAFRNTDYTGKWFFAFIDEVEFISPSCAKIKFTVDVYSTWFSFWQPKACFVVREHVNIADDVAGAYTLPENVELGEYVGNGGRIEDDQTRSLVFIINASSNISTDGVGNLYTDIGGIVMAGNLYVCDTVAQLASILNTANQLGKTDAITAIYAVPSILVGNREENVIKWRGQSTSPFWNLEIAKKTTIDGYTPKNKKLLTFPYQYLIMSNNNGTSNVLQYELFSDADVHIRYNGIPSIGGSIIAFPYNYKGSHYCYEEGITSGKFPTLSWSYDAFTNWLTSNAVNMGVGVASDVLQVASGITMMATGAGALAGAGMIANAGMSVASTMGQVYQHSLVPATAKGNINVGDILTSTGYNIFMYYPMSIKRENAIMIDNYFETKGYKVNTVKIPNQNNRTHYNYVEIASSENIGYSTYETRSVPAEAMEIINQIYRRGVTLWHDHGTLGDYSVDNRS